MKKIIALPVLGALFVSVMLLVFVFYWLKPTTASETVPQEEIIQSIEELYSGEMINMVDENEKYVLAIQNESGTYEVSVDSATGAVLSVVPLTIDSTNEEKPNNENDNSNNQQFLSKAQIRNLIKQSNPGVIEGIKLIENNQNSYYEVEVLHNSQRTTLKLEAMTGTIISSNTEKNEPTNKYISNKEAIAIAKDYLNGEVEDINFIENHPTPHYLVEIENDDNEATIQIHGVSGKILSVTWDEDEDDEDEEDEDDNEE